MNKLLTILSAILVSTYGTAALPNSSLSKGSKNLNALGSAWHAYHSVQPTLNKNDIEMGYGGQDIAHTPEVLAKAIV
jgi:hypothetical protein